MNLEFHILQFAGSKLFGQTLDVKLQRRHLVRSRGCLQFQGSLLLLHLGDHLTVQLTHKHIRLFREHDVNNRILPLRCQLALKLLLINVNGGNRLIVNLLHCGCACALRLAVYVNIYPIVCSACRLGGIR
ncbi:hypothetical protein D3C75_1039220 [compost metagenome]